jgi:hypothetical protein
MQPCAGYYMTVRLNIAFYRAERISTAFIFNFSHVLSRYRVLERDKFKGLDL